MIEVIVITVALVLTVWSVVDISENQTNKSRKIGWFAIVILIPIIGPISYYFTRRKEKPDLENK